MAPLMDWDDWSPSFYDEIQYYLKAKTYPRAMSKHRKPMFAQQWLHKVEVKAKFSKVCEWLDTNVRHEWHGANSPTAGKDFIFSFKHKEDAVLFTMFFS